MSMRFFQRLMGMGQPDPKGPQAPLAALGPVGDTLPPRTGARIPDGLRVYAVGDVHGRVDLFDRMARLIAQDLVDCPPRQHGHPAFDAADPAIPALAWQAAIGGGGSGAGLALKAPPRHDEAGGETAAEARGLATDQARNPVYNPDHHPAQDPARSTADNGAMPAGGVVTVFLGDYIDRGPASRQVIDRLVVGEWSTPFITLMGNHELMCLQFLQDAETLWMWRDVGALSTLASYGVDVSPLMAASRTSDAAEVVRAAFAQAMPQAHFDFLTSSLQPCSSVGDYFFCHAGVRPGIPLAYQDALDLMTVRDVFLCSDADFGKVVVHGHTPQERPVFRRNRIGIDTGAYATGCLTCVVLEGEDVRILHTREAR